MKKSDIKQYEKAWENFYTAMKSFMISLNGLSQLRNEDFLIDDLNQITGRVEKLTKTIKRISEKNEGVKY